MGNLARLLLEVANVNEDVAKAEKALEMLNNRFLAVTVDDLINQPQVVDKLDGDLENAYQAVSRLEGRYEDSDIGVADELSTIGSKIVKIQNMLSDIRKAVSKK